MTDDTTAAPERIELFDRLHIENMTREWFAGPNPTVDGFLDVLRLRLRRAAAHALSPPAPAEIDTIKADATVAFPSSGFARGSIVRLFGQGPNMLVVRSGFGSAENRTVCVLCESDEPGGLRVKDFVTGDLEIALNDAGRLDAEFDLRWAADMRAIKRWQSEESGRDLTWPDHADLVVWLMGQLDAASPTPTAEATVTDAMAEAAARVLYLVDKFGFEFDAEYGRAARSKYWDDLHSEDISLDPSWPPHDGGPVDCGKLYILRIARATLDAALRASRPVQGEVTVTDAMVGLKPIVTWTIRQFGAKMTPEELAAAILEAPQVQDALRASRPVQGEVK